MLKDNGELLALREDMLEVLTSVDRLLGPSAQWSDFQSTTVTDLRYLGMEASTIDEVRLLRLLVVMARLLRSSIVLDSLGRVRS
jgi:hypothetical protein